LHQLLVATLTPKLSHVRLFAVHRKNWVGTIFFLLLAGVVLLESFRLGVGTFRSPQAGFFPFFAGAVLGLLSTLSFLFEIKANSSNSGKKPAAGETKLSLKVVLVLVSLLVYGLLLDVLGFILCTAAIIIFWLKIVVPQRASTVITSAIFIPLVAYFLFHVWLRVPLPKGFLTF
jgi:putative tricarboxylic transport membrane protein